MPRLRFVKRARIAEVLRENGLQESTKRGKGSHTWWEHPADASRATSVPGDDEIPIGTVNSILDGARKDRTAYQRRFRGLGS